MKYSFSLPKVLTFVNMEFVLDCLGLLHFREGLLALLAKNSNMNFFYICLPSLNNRQTHSQN